MNFRIGHGYDVHRLMPERDLILGGVHIPFEKGLLGHSDADVITHAIIDALLGAAKLGDIGQNFPDSQPQYKGISSITLLEHTGALLAKQGYKPGNIDGTILMEKPKIASYLRDMEQNIATALGVDVSCVNLKATTEEGLGFTGTGEGVAAHGVCIIYRGA